MRGFLLYKTLLRSPKTFISSTQIQKQQAEMNSFTRLIKQITLSNPSKPTRSLNNSVMWHSTVSFNDTDAHDTAAAEEVDFDDFIDNKKLEPQGVDPKKGWNFRGVHKAIICGTIGQTPVQKILRNGKTVTIFTVGTCGMYDQRILGSENLPRPAQWHRIAVHEQNIGAYSVQKLVKGSAVYVEGDIETRVYNDSITGQVKNVPEICVRRDGKVRLVKAGESTSNISLDDLKDGLF